MVVSKKTAIASIPDHQDDVLKFLESEIDLDVHGMNLSGRQVVQYWEKPIMHQLASYATQKRGCILEIGYGLGMCASYIQKMGVDEHIIIEAHPEVAAIATAWAKNFQNVRIIQGFWQNEIANLKQFDAVVFDPHPLIGVPQGHYTEILPRARRLLRSGGCLTYVSLESIVSTKHLQLLFKHFDSFDLTFVRNLVPPKACAYWRGDCMVVPCARKLKTN